MTTALKTAMESIKKDGGNEKTKKLHDVLRPRKTLQFIAVYSAQIAKVIVKFVNSSLNAFLNWKELQQNEGDSKAGVLA